MSAEHGEIVMQKPISEYAEYIKNLIPVNIPDSYALRPVFENVAGEEDIRNGVIAFRDFLYVFCDRLITDGHLYSKPKKTKNPADYPFLQHMNRLLLTIGYYSKLSESGGSLLATEIPSFTAARPTIPVSKQMECLRFLALCGFVFTGIDLEAKTFSISEGFLKISYPEAPLMLTGLKALSIAGMEMWVRFYNNADNLFRCDYRVIKAEDTDVFDVLKDMLHPLPEEIQKFALELHQRSVAKGMTCAIINDDAVHFAYSNSKNGSRPLSPRDIYSRRIWEFAVSVKYGYCFVVRSKKTEKYADAIKNFPVSLQKKIADGYGCDRKQRNEPCQGGCQGIRLPLDDSVVKMKRDIEIWLDNEAMC